MEFPEMLTVNDLASQTRLNICDDKYSRLV